MVSRRITSEHCVSLPQVCSDKLASAFYMLLWLAGFNEIQAQAYTLQHLNWASQLAISDTPTAVQVEDD